MGEGVNAFLATVDLSHFRIAVEQRKKIAKRLKDIEASQRATGRLLGVSKDTIRGDLSPEPSGERGQNSAEEMARGDNSPTFDDAEARMSREEQKRKRAVTHNDRAPAW